MINLMNTCPVVFNNFVVLPLYLKKKKKSNEHKHWVYKLHCPHDKKKQKQEMIIVAHKKDDSLGEGWNWTLVVGLLPFFTIKMPDLNMFECTWCNTVKCHSNAIRIWSCHIKRSNATVFAECMFCRVGAEGVGGKGSLGVA